MRLHVALAMVLSAAGACFAAESAHLVLSYDRPAQAWMTEALPIGNGSLGGMVFGGVDSERIQFNEISLWTGDEKDTGAYQAFGDLLLDLESAAGTNAPVTHYRRELDVAKAIHRVSYTRNGVQFQRECFVSHPAQVLVLRLTASEPGQYSGAIRLSDAHQAKAAATNNCLSFSGALPNGLAYEAQVLVQHEAGEVVGDGQSIQFHGVSSLTVFLAAGTSYAPSYAQGWRGPHPHKRLASQLQSAANQPYARLQADHVKDYAALFERMELNLGATAKETASLTTDRRLVAYNKGGEDPELEQLFFQYGRYLLISSSRAGGLPANLQGLWNDSNNPPWRCDYHSNINIQMNYWPAEVTGLPECDQPLLDYIDHQREVRKKATQAYYHCQRGWTVQTENNIYGAGSFVWNAPASAWYCQHLWEHYAFTQDKKYLKAFAYPIMKEVCEFWQDRLQELPDHTLVTPDGWSPEHGPHEPGVTFDQEIIWDLFNNYVEAADILKIDPTNRQAVAQMREKLLKPKVGRWGQLMEWMEDIDDPRDTHRHTSHLYALHPGRQISPDTTPELAAAAKKSLQARGDQSTGWAMAWRINFWARLLDGDHAHLLLHNLLTLVGGLGVDYGSAGGVYSNLLDAHPPFQIDGNFGATAGMAEMLLQSQAGDLHLLPALPKAWPNGWAKGLRARGGFLVDIYWNNGRLTEARLTPMAGAKQCRVRYGEKTAELTISGKKPLTLSPELEPFH